MVHSFFRFFLSFAAVAVSVSPAIGATVIPIAGSVGSAAFAGVRSGPGAYNDDSDVWITTPTGLAATSVASYFPNAGGLASASDTASATWAASGLSGTALEDQQALLIVPHGAEYIALTNNVNEYWWRYQFHVISDAIFTMILGGDQTISATGDYGTASFFDSGFYMNGTEVPGTFDGSLFTFTYALLAGHDYTAGIRFQGQFSANEGTGVDNTTETASWTITDPTTNPGGGTSSPVPEPSTWALMLVGFSAVGFIMRRQGSGRRTTIGLT